MKQTALFAAFLFCTVFGFSQESYADSLTKERKKHEKAFLSEVLNEEERKIHPEICFFPIDPSFVVTAEFTKEVGAAFVMPTTGNRPAYYRKVGFLSFKVKDRKSVV